MLALDKNLTLHFSIDVVVVVVVVVVVFVFHVLIVRPSLFQCRYSGSLFAGLSSAVFPLSIYSL